MEFKNKKKIVITKGKKNKKVFKIIIKIPRPTGNKRPFVKFKNVECHFF